MTELVVLNFKAAEGKFDALGDMFRAVLGDTRAYDGCIKVDVYEDEGSNTITLVEEWESLAHQQEYLGGFDNGVTVHTWGNKKDY